MSEKMCEPGCSEKLLECSQLHAFVCDPTDCFAVECDVVGVVAFVADTRLDTDNIVLW